MTTPLQQFFLDLKNFVDDLRNLLTPAQLRATLAVTWHELLQDRRRQLPLMFTLAVHLGALLLSLAGPLLFSGKVRVPEVYRIELYSAIEPEPAPLQKPAPAPLPAPAPVAKPAVLPQVKAPAKTASATPPKPVERPKAVSLSPIKERLRKEREEREAQERQARLLDLRVEQLELARRQKEAEQEAREAASQAVDKIAGLYRTAPSTTPVSKGEDNVESRPAAAPGPPGHGDPTPRQLEALERFKARLMQQIAPNWQLPDLQSWDETLSATIAMRMKWDGTVENTWFEKKSGNYRFDQYVKKAIDNSLPLPPLPLELDRKHEEIAVTFTPGGLR